MVIKIHGTVIPSQLTLSMYLHKSGCLAQCLNLLATALELSGEDELLRVNLMNTAATIVEKQNRSSDAERMFLQCLQVR